MFQFNSNFKTENTRIENEFWHHAVLIWQPIKVKINKFNCLSVQFIFIFFFCNLSSLIVAENYKRLKTFLRWDHTIVVMHQFYTIFIVLNMGSIKKLSQSNSLQSDDCFIVHKVGCRKLTGDGLVAIIAAFQSHDCSRICQLWETAVVLGFFCLQKYKKF